jgi:DNA-binding transcriptional ArsR family regulator
MLRRLRVRGPATATQLAAALGDTVPSASYHLRQLARFGYVEDAAGLGNQRERWWQAVDAGDRIESNDPNTPEMATASAELAVIGIRYAADVAERYLARSARSEVPADVAKSAWLSNSGVHVTVEEARALGREFDAIIARYRSRIDPADRPEGTQLFHLSIQLVPWELP